MKNNNEVEISYESNETFFVERKEKLEDFLDDIYDTLEKKGLIKSAENELKQFLNKTF